MPSSAKWEAPPGCPSGDRFLSSGRIQVGISPAAPLALSPSPPPLFPFLRRGWRGPGPGHQRFLSPFILRGALLGPDGRDPPGEMGEGLLDLPVAAPIPPSSCPLSLSVLPPPIFPATHLSRIMPAAVGSPLFHLLNDPFVADRRGETAPLFFESPSWPCPTRRSPGPSVPPDGPRGRLLESLPMYAPPSSAALAAFVFIFIVIDCRQVTLSRSLPPCSLSSASSHCPLEWETRRCRAGRRMLPPALVTYPMRHSSLMRWGVRRPPTRPTCGTPHGRSGPSGRPCWRRRAR